MKGEKIQEILDLTWVKMICYTMIYSVTGTHLCLICKSLYSSRRITAPARVSSRTATLTSKLQQDFPAGPGELQVFGGCGVWRGPSIPRLGLMIAWTRPCWTVSNGVGFLSTAVLGCGGIWRDVLLVTWWLTCIVPSLIERRREVVCCLMSVTSTCWIRWGEWAGVSREASNGFKCQMLCNIEKVLSHCMFQNEAFELFSIWCSTCLLHLFHSSVRSTFF